jgi:flagellar biosynthetic protein FliR
VIESFISRAVLVAFRVGGLMTFAPFFSNASLPVRIKAVFTVALTILLLPVYTSPGFTPEPPTTTAWASLALTEAALGLMTGLAVQFVFDGMQLAGQIISFQFGFSLVNIIDPNTQVEITVLSTFYDLATLLIFMQLGVHRWILRALATSFQLIPVGALPSVALRAPELLRMATAMWLIGAEIAFPLLLATMLTDVTIGFLSKASPQFPALFFGISIKFLLGTAVLYGALAYWPGLLERHFFHALSHLEDLLSLLHGGA